MSDEQRDANDKASGPSANQPVSRRQFMAVGAGVAAMVPFTGGLAKHMPMPFIKASDSTGLRMFMVPKWTTYPYFKAVSEGARTAAEKVGATLTYTGPTSPNAEQQVASLENVLAQEPDIILLAAIEEQNVVPVLKKAMARGVVVVTYDADTAPDARDLFCNQLTYQLAAQSFLDCALADDPSGGDCVFMAASPTTVNHMQQIAAMKTAMATIPKYKTLNPGKTYFVNDDVALSYSTAVNIMQAQPNVKFILSGSAVSVPAAQQAVVSTGHAGKVWAAGCALPSDCKKFLEDGSAKEFMVWDPAQLGYMAAYSAYLIKTNKFVPKVGAELEIPTLGNFQIAADNIADMNRPLFLTKENVSQYKF
jgi:rhamnose transport system substrate-binding protein